MTARSGSEVRNRAKQISVRLTDAEYEQLMWEAKSIRVSPGELLRWSFFNPPARYEALARHAPS